MDSTVPQTNFDARSVVSLFLGLVVAGAVLYVLIRFVGFGDVVTALRSAAPLTVTAAFLASLCWMIAWSHTLSLVFGVLDGPIAPWQAGVLYLNVLFANTIAPFSVGGGEPIAALLVSRTSRTSYETSLLVVLGTDVLNYLPAPVFAIFGLVYVATTRTLSREVEVAMSFLAAISVVFVVLGVLGWRYRRLVERRAVAVVVALQRPTARLLPNTKIPSPDSLRARVDAFAEGLERIAADRPALAEGFLASALGWGFQATVLWLALLAVDERVSVGVSLFVVTLVTVTDLVPLPGGLGSVDAALVALLSTTTGIPLPAATAATLIFRSATLLFPIVLGSAVVAISQLDLLTRQ